MFDRSSPFAMPAGAHPQLPGAGSKVDFATGRLRQAILACELFPGERVSEQEVGKRFSLGRAATRSALAHLAGEDLVEVRPRKGWRVTPIAPRLIRDLAEARHALEPMLAGLSLSPSVVERLEQIAGINHALVHRGDDTAIVTARRYDREFLDVLASAGNIWTARWLGQAWNNSERTVCFFESQGSGRMCVPERTRLVEALRRADTPAAADCLTDAIREFERFTSKSLLSLPIDLTPNAAARASAVGAAHRGTGTKNRPSRGSTPEKKGNSSEEKARHEPES